MSDPALAWACSRTERARWATQLTSTYTSRPPRPSPGQSSRITIPKLAALEKLFDCWPSCSSTLGGRKLAEGYFHST